MDTAKLLLGAEQITLALYAISFMVEMAVNSYTKDEIEIIDGLPDDDDTYENSYVKSGGYDELVFAEKVVPVENENDEVTANDEDPESPPTFDGLDDFVLGYNNNSEPEPVPYLTKNEMEKIASSRLVFLDEEPEKTEEKTEASKPDISYDVMEEKIREEVTPVEEKPIESKPEEKTPESTLSDIDLLLQELDNKK